MNAPRLLISVGVAIALFSAHSIAQHNHDLREAVKIRNELLKESLEINDELMDLLKSRQSRYN